MNLIEFAVIKKINNQKKLIMCDFDDDYYDSDCPKCGRTYDEIDSDYQICSKCGWNAEKETYGDTREPTDADYQMGNADILTGHWY